MSPPTAVLVECTWPERWSDRWSAIEVDSLDVDPVAAAAAAFDADRAAEAALLESARQAERTIAAAQAQRARALAAFAACRPAAWDRPEGALGSSAATSRATRAEILLPVSEFCVDEVAVALTINGHAASTIVERSLLLIHRLPGTLAELSAGAISWAHVLVACELIAPLSPQLRERAEQELLPKAQSRTAQAWRPIVRKLVLKLDADAITRRVEAAVRQRKVVVYPAQDGMATLSATLPLPVARAVEDILRRLAQAATFPGDERSLGERMADCLVDLLLRPGEHGLNPVQAQLTAVASVRTLLGGDEPGEIAGDVVPAAVVRELAYTLGLLPRPTEPATVPATDADAVPGECQPGGPDTDDVVDDSRLAQAPAEGDAQPATSGPDQQPTSGGPTPPERDGLSPPADPATRAALADLLNSHRITDTALTARPRIALVDEATGELVALTDAAAIRAAVRANTGLGPPPETAGYRPGDLLDAFVRTRDKRCQFPGCRARPTTCDLDHICPYLTGGATTCHNLTALCRHHHRLSHQAPGWQLRRTDDGAGLVWTTPTGTQHTTRPEPIASVDHPVDQPPAELADAVPDVPDLPPF